jgi:biopolymer transport protein ExbB
MQNNFTFFRLLDAGGPILILLFLFFIAAVIIIAERLIYFRGLTIRADFFLSRILTDKKELIMPADLPVDAASSPYYYVFKECMQSQLNRKAFNSEIFEEVKSRAIAEIIPSLEKYFSSLATMTSVSPFLGLLGTVIGIIHAFMSMGAEAGANQSAMEGLNAGIAEALITTAAGLFVAIPASVAYNYFRRTTDLLILDIEIGVSRLKTLYTDMEK